MKVVCIKNTAWDKIWSLTINKIYNVEHARYDFEPYLYILKDDENANGVYPKDWFITLEEYRNQQINKIIEL